MRRHLLVIGAQRCGTTQLHALLEAHPDIAMARPARPEPKVFLSPEVVERGLGWYVETYFAHATTETMLGEKSTSYLEVAAAADRAAAVLGEAQVVVQLRDPVARAVSNWRFSSANGLELRSLSEALEQNLRERMAWDAEATSVSPFGYLERGRYAEQLDPWFASFPGTVHVRFLEDVVESHSIVKLYEALGVDPDFVPSPPETPLNRSDGEAPQLDDSLRRRLQEYFGPADDQLRKRLGRELPWPAQLG